MQNPYTKMVLHTSCAIKDVLLWPKSFLNQAVKMFICAVKLAELQQPASSGHLRNCNFCIGFIAQPQRMLCLVSSFVFWGVQNNRKNRNPRRESRKNMWKGAQVELKPGQSAWRPVSVHGSNARPSAHVEIFCMFGHLESYSETLGGKYRLWSTHLLPKTILELQLQSSEGIPKFSYVRVHPSILFTAYPVRGRGRVEVYHSCH